MFSDKMLMGKQSNNLQKQSFIQARHKGQNNQYMEQAKEREVYEQRNMYCSKKDVEFFSELLFNELENKNRTEIF